MAERNNTSASVTDEVVTPFRCPACHEPLILERNGAENRCRGCSRPADGASGVLDLVIDARRDEERAYYEHEYATQSVPAGAAGDLNELGAKWEHPAKPVNRALARHLGDLAGRRVLLVGNGGKAQELVFLKQNPKLLVFSDLSSAGVAQVRDRFDLSGHEGQLWFASLDALDIPLADASVDVVYGNAIVHHLPDRERFLQEVVRVLAPGGRAVFVDTGYSPIWQRAKLTVLWPLMNYSHRLHPRSPEDVRDTVEGGFHEEEFSDTIRRLGAEPWFERLSFAFYLWRRATLVLLPERLARFAEHPRIAGPLIRFDERLARSPRGRQHLIRLIWGLYKPA